MRRDLKMATRLQLLAAEEDDSGISRSRDVPMTVIHHVGCAGVARVLPPYHCLEGHTPGFLSCEGLQMRHSILPVELSALLLPLVVCLNLFLLPVGVAERFDLTDGELAFLFGVLGQLDKFFDLNTHCPVLIRDHLLDFGHFVLEAVFDGVHFVLNRLLLTRSGCRLIVIR